MRPIPRSLERAALQSRMHMRQTSANANDLIGEITAALQEARRPTTFDEDLHARLTEATLHEIMTGKMNYFAFQRLVKSVLYSLGAKQVEVRGGPSDKGTDLVADFEIARAL